jgi:hypothetical protein
MLAKGGVGPGDRDIYCLTEGSDGVHSYVHY